MFVVSTLVPQKLIQALKCLLRTSIDTEQLSIVNCQLLSLALITDFIISMSAGVGAVFCHATRD